MNEKLSKYKALVGIDSIYDRDEIDEMYSTVKSLLESVKQDETVGTFEVLKEEINSTHFYFVEINIQEWASTLLFIKYPELRWELVKEES